MRANQTHPLGLRQSEILLRHLFSGRLAALEKQWKQMVHLELSADLSPAGSA